MAGRSPGFRHNDETRAKIKAAQIINRLMNHVEAEKPILDASQVNAAKALLNKVLPDLQAITHDGSIGLSPIQGLLDAIDGRSKAVPETD